MVSLLDGRLDRLQKVGIWEKLIISKTRHQGWVRRKRPVAPFPFNFLMCLITFWNKKLYRKKSITPYPFGHKHGKYRAVRNLEWLNIRYSQETPENPQIGQTHSHSNNCRLLPTNCLSVFDHLVGFLVFSGCIKWKHWSKMRDKLVLNLAIFFVIFFSSFLWSYLL